MNCDDLDLIFTHRVQEVFAGKQLPASVSTRLLESLRRRRRMFRIKIVAAIVVMAVLGGALGHFTFRKTEPPTQAMLVSTNHSPKDTEASGWMLFGFLRECFKRNRTNKRKEEDQ